MSEMDVKTAPAAKIGADFVHVGGTIHEKQRHAMWVDRLCLAILCELSFAKASRNRCRLPESHILCRR